jgi:Nucleoside-diphosphate-sugar pyrophosphorylase involved in lipopolysaccharide biosynthesis/translation initiation factor 2B, gamma/epsilon subunits (eIF-2Bgamma/eIF-2Bepsilon)
MQKIKTAFVLGAGLGTRLRPLTDNTPKPMLPVGGIPLIARIFADLVNAGIMRIIVNTHHAAYKYAEEFPSNTFMGAELIFVHEEKLLDTGGGLKNILPLLKEDAGILVYNGDILYTGNIAKFLNDFENSQAEASLVLRSAGAVCNVSVCGEYVCDMRGILGAEYDVKMQFCGVFAASRKVLDAFAARSDNVFSTVDVLVDFIKQNPESVKAYADDESQWSDIGTAEEYLRVK